MVKPQGLGGYDGDVTAACERVLVTLLSGLGPWKESVYLVGGLVPRYVVKARPPEVPPHAGTADVDIVVDLALLTDTAAYETLEENLKRLGFERGENARGQVVNWRWKTKTEIGVVLVLEFLADDPELGGGRVQELPTKGNISALNIPHASMVFDLHDKVEITAELLGGGGQLARPQVVEHGAHRRLGQSRASSQKNSSKSGYNACWTGASSYFFKSIHSNPCQGLAGATAGTGATKPASPGPGKGAPGP